MTTPLGSGAGPATTSTYQQGQRIGPDELRTMFLFEALTADQLDWIAQRSRVELFPAGDTVYTEGEPATCFYVLLAGTITMTRRVGGEEVELTRSSQRGAYAGATASFTDPPPGQQHRYPGSLRAVTDVAMMALPAEEFAPQLRSLVPDGDAPHRGHAHRTANVPGRRRAAGEAGRPRRAHRGPDPRAEQPRRGRRPGDLVAARAHRRHAAQARAAGQDEHRRGRPGPAGRAAGGRGQAGRGRPDAVTAGGQRPRGRHGQLAGGPRGRRRVGARADLRRRRAHARLDGAAAVGDGRGGPERVGALAGVQRRDRDAHDRDRGGHPPDLDAGVRGEELLAHGPRRARVGRRPRGPQEHSDDPDASAARASPWSRSSTARCRRSSPTPASSTRCGPTSSTTRRRPWTARAPSRSGRPGTATTCWSRSATPVPASRRSCRSGSSSRSSRRRASGREPASASTSPGRSSSTGTAATCSVVSSPGDTHFQVRLPIRTEDSDLSR